MVTYKAWFGAGALAVGMGAASLACSGVADADTAGPAPHHTIAAAHAPVKPVAHDTPRPKPAAALIAASMLAGVADHKPIPAAVVTHSAATSSAPPNPTASAVPAPNTSSADQASSVPISVLILQDINHLNPEQLRYAAIGLANGIGTVIKASLAVGLSPVLLPAQLWAVAYQFKWGYNCTLAACERDPLFHLAAWVNKVVPWLYKQ